MHRPSQQYVDSCAYHEAGHTVVAVALGMPLRNRGVHIDTNGSGIAYYWYRTVGDLNNTSQDIAERERTIITAYAGYIAQEKFYPKCPSSGSFYDTDGNRKLLDEVYPDGPEWFAAQERLHAEARRLVDVHWQAIEALAKAILARPLTPRPDDPERVWSTDTHERSIDGNRVVSILKDFQLQPFIRDESEGKFYPNVTPGAAIDPAPTDSDEETAMSENICPVCKEPYDRKQELSTVTTYYHTPPKPDCKQYAMPGNPNRAETTPSSMRRRQDALKSKRR
jgi:hypothetical protein